MINLYQGDCLEVMKQIPDKSVDMVLCDLPYGTTACKWDSIIPLDQLWGNYRRLCSGAIVLTAAQPFTSALVMSNIAAYKNRWVWRKEQGTGFLHAKHAQLKDTEDIVVFCFGRAAPYNPQMTSGAPYSAASKGKSRAGTNGKTFEGHMPFGDANNDNAGLRYPKEVLDFSRSKDRGLHPTQKPVALMEYLIRTYTNEGDTVLDNCMGSGTTGVACVNTNRKFIGIEKEENYFQIAEKRIKEAQNETSDSWLLELEA